VEAILLAMLKPSLEILSQDEDTRLIRAKFIKPYALLKTSAPEDIHATIQQLVKFFSPGLRS
jgi:hypothetical protein